MLGPFSVPLAACLLLGFCVAVLRKNWHAVLFLLSGVALSTLSIVIIAAGDMANIFFGATWQLIFVLTSLSALGVFGPKWELRLVAILFCVASGLIFFTSDLPKGVWTVSKDTARKNSLNAAVVHEISAFASQEPRKSLINVFATFFGTVNSVSQAWLALSDDLPLDFHDLQRSGSIEDNLTAIQSADFVEVADPVSKWMHPWLPINALQNKFLDHMRQNSNFEELPPVRGPKGRSTCSGERCKE